MFELVGMLEVMMAVVRMDSKYGRDLDLKMGAIWKKKHVISRDGEDSIVLLQMASWRARIGLSSRKHVVSVERVFFVTTLSHLWYLRGKYREKSNCSAKRSDCITRTRLTRPSSFSSLVGYVRIGVFFAVHQEHIIQRDVHRRRTDVIDAWRS